MIDRYDAPYGYVAVRGEKPCCCGGCIFSNKFPCEGECCAEDRKDGEDVIFKTRAGFEKMLLQEVEHFYGKGKVKRIIFTKDNIK